MNTFTPELQEYIYDYTIGNAYFWKIQFNYVLGEIQCFNVDEIVKEYFVAQYFREKHLYLDILNCYEFIGGNYFREFLLNNILSTLKRDNHCQYHAIKYHFECIRKCQLTWTSLNFMS